MTTLLSKCLQCQDITYTTREYNEYKLFNVQEHYKYVSKHITNNFVNKWYNQVVTILQFIEQTIYKEIYTYR